MSILKRIEQLLAKILSVKFLHNNKIRKEEMK